MYASAYDDVLRFVERPDCVFQSVCETCTFFQTSIDFRPTHQAQHDHAAAHDQDGRRRLFADPLNRVDEQPAS